MPPDTVTDDIARYTIRGAFGFWEIARAEPDRLAVVDARGDKTTYGQLLVSANRIAHGLIDLGLTAGDSVALLLSNEITFLGVQLATSQSGFYLTPIKEACADRAKASSFSS